MEPTLTVHTLTVPTLMVHLVAPNVLLNRYEHSFSTFCTFIYFWTLIASRNVRYCPGWNHETAGGDGGLKTKKREILGKKRLLKICGKKRALNLIIIKTWIVYQNSISFFFFSKSRQVVVLSIQHTVLFKFYGKVAIISLLLLDLI